MSTPTLAAVHPLRLLAARVVWLLHSGVTGWLLLGPLLPSPTAAWALVVGNPLIHLQWRIFENRCLLTILEERLRGPSLVRKVAVEDEAEPMGCVAETLSRALGRPITHAFADRLSYGVLWAGFVVAAARLLAARA